MPHRLTPGIHGRLRPTAFQSALTPLMTLLDVAASPVSGCLVVSWRVLVFMPVVTQLDTQPSENSQKRSQMTARMPIMLAITMPRPLASDIGGFAGCWPSTSGTSQPTSPLLGSTVRHSKTQLRIHSVCSQSQTVNAGGVSNQYCVRTVTLCARWFELDGSGLERGQGAASLAT